MGGWASILVFCSGRAGGRRDFVVENRVGVGGRPDTPGPVGGPAINASAPKSCMARAPELVLCNKEQLRTYNTFTTYNQEIIQTSFTAAAFPKHFRKECWVLDARCF